MTHPTLRPVAAALACAATLAAMPAHAGTWDIFTLVGNASIVDANAIQLTPPQPGQAGAAWLKQPIDVTRNFEVKFSFSLKQGSNPQADGIAFVLQTDGAAAIGNGGGGLGMVGLHDAGCSVISTYTNDRVGLAVNGNPDSASRFPADLGSAGDIEGWEVISYDASAHVMKMKGQLGLDGTSYDIKAEGRTVDLAAALGTNLATIGMTGGTGENYADQRITAFTWKYLP